MSIARTEARHPNSAGLDGLALETCLSRLLDAQLASARVIEAAIPRIAEAVDLAVLRYQAGGRLIYAGAGSAGLMALADSLELAGTFGLPFERTPMLFAGGTEALLHMTGGVEDDPNDGQADLDRIDPTTGDLLICVSASGSTPFTLGVAQAAHRAGVSVVGITNVEASPLLDLVDIAILLDTGPEMIAGSTRMAAGTAQKIALNMFSTLVGMRLGHVYQGHMINLRAENGKLRRRAVRMVADIAGCDAAKAECALAATSGTVKAAVLVAAGASTDRAAELLEETRSHLGPALASLKKSTA